MQTAAVLNLPEISEEGDHREQALKPLNSIGPKPLSEPARNQITQPDVAVRELMTSNKPNEVESERSAILALPNDAILTLREVATWLKLHPKTVSQMARECRIPAITLPLGTRRKQFRFVKGAVGNWLSSAVVSSRR